MVILKILNNNLVLSRDSSNREVIVKGRGIAFQKRRGQDVDDSKIEKIYVADLLKKREHLESYLTSIPEDYFNFVEHFIDYVRDRDSLQLNPSIYFTLSDHIYGTFQRLDKGISIKNMLLMDIRQLYRKEYDIGVEMLGKMTAEFGRELPIDEAGFIALHLIDAQENNASSVEKIADIVQKVLGVVQTYYKPLIFEQDNMYYQRFVTHLKYFAQRCLRKELSSSDDSSLYQIIKEQYKEAYGCVKLVYLMMENDYDHQMTVDEMLYLILHIQKMTEDHYKHAHHS